MKDTGFIDIGYGFTGKWRICDLPVCLVCGLPVTSTRNTNGALAPDGETEDGRKKWKSSNGLKMSTIHPGCYFTTYIKSDLFVSHDWSDEITWEYEKIPLGNTERAIDEYRKMCCQEQAREKEERLGLGGAGGILSGNRIFGRDEEKSITLFDMVGTKQGVNAAYDNLIQWQPPQEKDKDGNLRVIEKYAHLWQAEAWKLRRKGMTYIQIHKALGERFPTQDIPHEDTIYTWLEDWYKEGDPMETRIREDKIKYELPWYEEKPMNARDEERLQNFVNRMMKLYKELMNIKDVEKDKRYAKLQALYTKFVSKYNHSTASLQALTDATEQHSIKRLGRLWAKLEGKAYIPEYLYGFGHVKSYEGMPSYVYQLYVYFDLLDMRQIAKLEGRDTSRLQEELDKQWSHIQERSIPADEMQRWAIKYRRSKRGK